MKRNTIHSFGQFFSYEEIDRLYVDDAIVDARNGGLLLGQSHDEGGIFLLYEFTDGFRLYGEVEGFEYLVNRFCSKEISDTIQNLNSIDINLYDSFEPYNFNDSITTINATSPNLNIYKAKYIIMDSGMAIVNKVSTKNHLDKLDMLNKYKGY